MLADVDPSKSDRQGVAAYQTFYIRRWLILLKPDKVMTYFYCHCKIDLICMFCIFLHYDYMFCNDGTEIKQYQAAPDFLFNVLDLF